MPELHPQISAERVNPDGSLTLTLWVAADMPLFAGHFPGYPILPGVLQLHWASRLGCERFGFAGAFSRALNIKFQKPILPNSEIELSLAYDMNRRQLEFVYRSKKGDHASGKLEFSA